MGGGRLLGLLPADILYIGFFAGYFFLLLGLLLAHKRRLALRYLLYLARRLSDNRLLLPRRLCLLRVVLSLQSPVGRLRRLVGLEYVHLELFRLHYLALVVPEVFPVLLALDAGVLGEELVYHVLHLVLHRGSASDREPERHRRRGILVLSHRYDAVVLSEKSHERLLDVLLKKFRTVETAVKRVLCSALGERGLAVWLRNRLLGAGIHCYLRVVYAFHLVVAHERRAVYVRGIVEDNLLRGFVRRLLLLHFRDLYLLRFLGLLRPPRPFFEVFLLKESFGAGLFGISPFRYRVVVVGLVLLGVYGERVLKVCKSVFVGLRLSSK